MMKQNSLQSKICVKTSIFLCRREFNIWKTWALLRSPMLGHYQHSSQIYSRAHHTEPACQQLVNSEQLDHSITSHLK